jgi:hypothetical protein
MVITSDGESVRRRPHAADPVASEYRTFAHPHERLRGGPKLSSSQESFLP